MDITTLLDQARPAERTIPLCLRGDLVAELEDLERQLAAVRQAGGTGSLAGDPGRAVAERIVALQQQMQDSTVTVRLRALPRRTYRALVAEHPPRRDDLGEIVEDDRDQGLNGQTFWPALIRASIVSPELTDQQLNKLLDEVLSDRQYEDLAREALIVNRGAVDVPFSPAASAIMRISGGESSAPSGSASASDASTAGSLASPSSVTPTTS